MRELSAEKKNTSQLIATIINSYWDGFQMLYVDDGKVSVAVGDVMSFLLFSPIRQDYWKRKKGTRVCKVEKNEDLSRGERIFMLRKGKNIHFKER